MKITRNAKALSPVIASIILIAVTVAVSIAVAAWMGALSFNFTNTEQLTFTNNYWSATDSYFVMSVKNTGSSAITVTDVRVDGVMVPNGNVTYRLSSSAGAWSAFTVGTTAISDVKGVSYDFNVTSTGSGTNFGSGIQYSFTVLTAKGNTFGPFITTAP